MPETGDDEDQFTYHPRPCFDFLCHLDPLYDVVKKLVYAFGKQLDHNKLLPGTLIMFSSDACNNSIVCFVAWSWKNHWCICWLKLQWQTAMWQKWQSNSTTGYLEFWRRMNFSCIFFRTDWAVSSQNKSKSHFKCGSAKLSFTRVTHWSPIQRFMSGISSSPVRQQFRKTLPTRKQRSSFLSAWMCKRNHGKHGKLLPKRRCKRGTRPKLPRQKNVCMRRCQILQMNLVIRFLQTLKWK